jgi:hypothetical protein
MSELPLFCEWCGAELAPGKGEFYVVRIEAFADPTPPSITAEDLQRNIAAEIERLLESMRDLSAQEAMDQVYRKMTLYLCTACYQRWIAELRLCPPRCADDLCRRGPAPLQIQEHPG